MEAVRQPIVPAIAKLLNWISLGKLDPAKKALGHDTLFHLYTVMRLADGSRWRVEKNEVWSIFPYNHIPDSQHSGFFRPLTGLTPSGLFTKAAANEGAEKFWVYDPVNANCQDATTALFRAAGITDPSLLKWINQPVKEIFSSIPRYVGKVSQAVTSLAARFDIVRHGNGLTY